MRLKRRGYMSAAVIVVLLTACAPTPSVVHPPPISSPIQRGSIELGGSPGVPAVSSRTGTLYVPIQCTTTYPSCSSLTLTHEVDVISTAGCNAQVRTDCRVVARARVGATPLAATVDEKTDTVYVANATGTVTVVNGARCNATVISGCGTPLATINVGGFLVAAVIDPLTRTLYVASPPGNGFVTSNVFVINVAMCNSVTTQGCGQPVKKVADGQGPTAIDVDVATDTVYAVNFGSGNGNTVSVIDGAKCNGSTDSGCDEAPRTITVGSGAFWDAVDQDSGTVYVANTNDGTVSVIDGARCNATITSGCASMPKAVLTGAGTASVAVDASLHTLFALNSNDDTLSALDTRICNGAVTSGCGNMAPNVQTESNQNPGYIGFLNSLTLLPHTDTAYVVNVGGYSRASVITLGRCDATNRSGCRVPARGQIAFTLGFGPTGDRGNILCTIEPNGTGFRVLTAVTAAGDAEPAWTPKGDRILYYSASTDGASDPNWTSSNLFSIDPNGGPIKQLTFEPTHVYDESPAISPDGARIAFDRFDLSGRRTGIYLMNADGSHIVRITTPPASAAGGDTEPNFSPDGTKLAFVRDGIGGGEGAIYIVGVDGKGLRQVTPASLDAAGPRWSPNGSKLLFGTPGSQNGVFSGRNVYVVNSDGSGLTGLTHEYTPDDAFNPAWSPDGTMIVFEQGLAGVNFIALVVMHADGSHQKVIWHPTPQLDIFPGSLAWGTAP
jgi:DNA-binding beta-propeller fold protein YncE